MLKKIYFTFFGYPISLFLNLFGRIFSPFMIYGFWNNVTRSFKKHTRYSSTTIFINKNKVDIEDGCWIGPNCIIDGSGGLRIGKGVQIAGLTGIFSHSSHIAIRLCGENYLSLNPNERFGYIHKPVIIGEYTFIGCGAIILPGVTIGKGCIVGAGSIVNKSIPDFSVAAGNPAKLINSTLEIDEQYFNNADVQHVYFDPKIIEKYRNKIVF